MTRILVLGDIVGAPGRRAVARRIAGGGYDLVVANGENASGGIGITPAVASQLLDSGVGVITSGNHIWAQKDIGPYLDRCGGRLLRPANLPPGNPGAGHVTVRCGDLDVMVVNLQGRVFMSPADCPFRTADRLLAGSPPPVVIVDFHAEATSEKIAMGRHLDGRASVVAGTHTHVQTADAGVLPSGTLFMTDLGMCGSPNGVIGVRWEGVRERFLAGRPGRLSVAEGDEMVNGLEACFGDAGELLSWSVVNDRV